MTVREIEKPKVHVKEDLYCIISRTPTTVTVAPLIWIEEMNEYQCKMDTRVLDAVVAEDTHYVMLEE